LKVKVVDHVISKVTWFKYLGSIVQNDGELEANVKHRIQARWLKWRRASWFCVIRRVRSKEV